MDAFINYCVPLYLFLYFIISIILLLRDKKNCLEIVKSSIPPALVALLIAYAVYIKASDFLDRSILFQVSDRCLTKDIKINDETGRIYPIFINQGGDVLAYEELVRQYNKSKGEFHDAMRKVLSKIYNNIQSADDDFQKEYFVVCRSRNEGEWVFNTPGDAAICWGVGAELWDEFSVPNVISQTHHTTYWTTRARSAKLLQNLDYLRDKKNFNEVNLQKLKDYNWKIMFENLVENIGSDPSLIVRKISLDTYKLWVCLDSKSEQERAKCEDRFVSDNIYHFGAAVEYWENNKSGILSNFKMNIGLQ